MEMWPPKNIERLQMSFSGRKSRDTLHWFMAISTKVLGPLVFVILLSVTFPCGAAALFEDDEVLEMTLTGPLDSVLDDTVQRREQPFVLHVGGADISILARVRGNSRARVCRFPPLRLNFTGSEVRQTVFEGQKKLKLVSLCREGERGRLDVLDEFAAYRIFNVLSDISYRVRLFHITYVDTDGRSKLGNQPSWGFVIEPGEQLAERAGGEWARLPGVKMSQVAESQAALVFVFQYLIGNTDWSFLTADGDDACCHNGDLLIINHKLNYVPYDFDLAGLVNAAYAKPDASLRLRSVTKRRYRGYCLSQEALRGAIQTVKSKKEDILGVLTEIPGYTGKEVEDTTDYLGGFFELAQDEEKLLKTFERACLK